MSLRFSKMQSRFLSAQRNFHWVAFLLVIFVGILIVSCREGRKFYVLEEVRVPAFQSLQKFSAPVDGQHCFDLAGETVCQQYPLRPAQKVLFRFLALTPATTLPVNISIKKLQRAKLPQVLTRDSDCETIRDAVAKVRQVDVPLTMLGLSDAQWIRQIKQETPMRVEEHILAFNTPAAATLLAEPWSEGWLPLFTLEYEARSEDTRYRADRGAFTFTIESAPQPGSGSDGAAPDLAARCLAEAFSGGASSAATNTPPVILSISPAQSSQVAGSPLDLQIVLSGDDPDPNAKRRVEWYVSRGELENQRAAKTQLTFSGAEPLTAVGIVRDLQGGLDFAWTTFSGN